MGKFCFARQAGSTLVFLGSGSVAVSFSADCRALLLALLGCFSSLQRSSVGAHTPNVQIALGPPTHHRHHHTCTWSYCGTTLHLSGEEVAPLGAAVTTTTACVGYGAGLLLRSPPAARPSATQPWSLMREGMHSRMEAALRNLMPELVVGGTSCRLDLACSCLPA